MRGRRITYTAAELEWLEENRTMPIADYHRAYQVRFSRDEVSADNLHALRKRRKWRTGRTGHYAKGQASLNKGKRMPFNPNSAATQFRKGQEPHNTKSLGHERVRKDGYVEINIAETNPYTGYHRRYVLKHKHLWEKANGPLPEGMCLKCLGHKANTDPSNWELVPRALLPRLNGRFGRDFDSAPAELKPTIMAVAKLEHRARQARQGKPA